MRYVVLAIVWVSLYAAASTMSYHDAVRRYEHCMAMVEKGAWPQEVCDV